MLGNRGLHRWRELASWHWGVHPWWHIALRLEALAHWRQIARRNRRWQSHSWRQVRRRNKVWGQVGWWEVLRRSHGWIHCWGRNVSGVSSHLLWPKLPGHVHCWQFWWLFVGKSSSHAEVHIRPSGVAPWLNSSVAVEVRPSWGLVSLGSFWLLFALHFSVLDVDSVFVDVSLLMV